jgi:GNAT superfamily N-acetyltransferase
MGYVLAITQPAAADFDIIHPLLAQSYWWPNVSRALVERAWARSVCMLARDDAGALIGFARVVTDSASFGYVDDVFVLEARRGEGIGRAMVQALRAHPELQGFKRWLLATRDAHGVYAGIGFAPLANPDRLMEIRDMDSYERGGR